MAFSSIIPGGGELQLMGAGNLSWEILRRSPDYRLFAELRPARPNRGYGIEILEAHPDAAPWGFHFRGGPDDVL
ncbi:hypothetical protein ACFB49_21960 [Sphingomonas sp. DBB INV C78]